MKSFFLALILIAMSALTNAQEKTDRQYPTRDFDYAAVQEQIDALAKDPKLDVYPLALAQAWLNSSKYEMWRNDAGWWPREAYQEAQRVVMAIKDKDQKSLAKVSQLKLNELIANDLWQEISVLKKLKKSCVKPLLARAEVELVHAAYEAQETTWKDATPQLSIVKSLLARAKVCQ